MPFMETGIAESVLVDRAPIHDEPGRFMRQWCCREFAEDRMPFLPVQANLRWGLAKGTVRGMHYQDVPASEAKPVRCIRGAVFDVVLDP
jgi:dTDP-4-dehydrorhamnose 3,5-epimerase